MIYTFTPQERKELEKIDLQELQAQKVLAAALDEHGKDSKEAQEAKTAYRVQSERIKKRFFYAFEELEKARFSALETPADIIADARQAAADALIYAYVRVYDLLDKKDLDGDRIPIVDLFNNAFSVYPLNWDFEHEFLKEKETGAADKKILFSEEGAKHYIYSIIERHAAALPNEPEKTELKAAIYDILNNSPYIDEMSPTAAPVTIQITEKIEKIDYPTDKINNNIWRLLEEADNGQLTFAVEKAGSKKEANILYSINFDALEDITITKKLTSYDKLVYIAVGALFNNGCNVITISQIYNAIGNTGRPNATNREKINNSLTKMSAARVYISNKSETQLYNKRPLFVYDSSLLPMKRLKVVANGVETAEATAIQLYEEPPLLTFAKGRKQITTINRSLLESPINKTNDNLNIQDYLIENIAYIKNGKANNKMLYSTIFEKLGIKDRQKKKRAKDTIKRFLEHYKTQAFIKDFREDTDGVTIFY